MQKLKSPLNYNSHGKFTPQHFIKRPNQQIQQITLIKVEQTQFSPGMRKRTNKWSIN